MAEAEMASARETHEAKLRLQGLQQAGEVEVSLAAATAERARAQVALYRAQLGQCSITAPFSGRAVKIAVKSHQGVTQGQPLLEIVSDGALKLRLNVPAKWVTWLKNGTPFEVRIDETGKTYKARVTALNGRIDAVSQSIELEASIDEKSPDLLPGMSGVAHFSVPR
jgi:RND family efflux transporter MFP subunit